MVTRIELQPPTAPLFHGFTFPRFDRSIGHRRHGQKRRPFQWDTGYRETGSRRIVRRSAAPPEVPIRNHPPGSSQAAGQARRSRDDDEGRSPARCHERELRPSYRRRPAGRRHRCEPAAVPDRNRATPRFAQGWLVLALAGQGDTKPRAADRALAPARHVRPTAAPAPREPFLPKPPSQPVRFHFERAGVGQPHQIIQVSFRRLHASVHFGKDTRGFPPAEPVPTDPCSTATSVAGTSDPT